MIAALASFNYRQACFLKSAANVSQCPPDTGREVAFAGRSNVGKSSALNALTGSNKLARTSKTPGRTQLLNFFTVVAGRYLVDLPGYGYAKVAASVKQQWQQQLNAYLTHRRSLVGLVLLVDIRHPLKAFDQMMLQWSTSAQLPVHVLLTKADKLKQGAARQALRQCKQALTDYPQVSLQCFSALKCQGIDELAAVLDQWLTGQLYNDCTR